MLDSKRLGYVDGGHEDGDLAYTAKVKIIWHVPKRFASIPAIVQTGHVDKE